MNRLFKPQHEPPRMWERVLTQLALVLWACEWIARGVHGAVLAAFAEHDSLFIPISYSISSLILLASGVLLLYATVRPLGGCERDLREVWMQYRITFAFALAAWVGLVAHSVLYKPAPMWWLSAVSNIALCVGGLVAVRLQERAVTAAVRDVEKRKQQYRRELCGGAA